MHSESVSSDPMSNDMMYDAHQPLDILPPIKLPQRRGRKPKNYLPALSVEEEALSASLGMSGDEHEHLHNVNDNDSFDADGYAAGDSAHNISHDGVFPVASPPPYRKRGRRPKSESSISSSVVALRAAMSADCTDIPIPRRRGRKPKSFLPSMLSPAHGGGPADAEDTSQPSSPLHGEQHPHQYGGVHDELFSGGTHHDILGMDNEIFNDLGEDYGGFIPVSNHSGVSSGVSSGGVDTDASADYENDEQYDLHDGEAISAAPARVPKKRGRKPKHSKKTKMVMKVVDGMSINKRKYTKRTIKNAREVDDASHLRRSARPPRASKAFDDQHYLLG